jgi:tetratricopeptide (TPR) repeat protein
MASDTTRASVLLEIAKLEGIKLAIRQFGPSSWESAARSALLCGSNPELQSALLNVAEEFWLQIDHPESRVSVDLRVSQLQSMNRDAEAIQFVEKLLAIDFDNIGLRKSKARLLEKSGLHEKAYDEWLRIESLSNKTDESDKALNRLIRLPPTTPH